MAADFIARNAQSNGFEDKKKFEEDGSGHPHSWMRLHEEYCSALDDELGDFCENHNVTSEDLFEKLNSSTSISKAVGEAMPIFVKLCSYEQFCGQMEAQASLEKARKEAEMGQGESGDLFSGIWRGLYNFSVKERDQHLKQLSVPWHIRRIFSTLMRKEGKFEGVVRYDRDENTLNRLFNFGILGKQNESFHITGKFEDFNGGFGKVYLRMKCDISDRVFTMRSRRYKDAAKTERWTDPKKGAREVVSSYKIAEDDHDLLLFHESIEWENGEVTGGWSYEMRRQKETESESTSSTRK